MVGKHFLVQEQAINGTLMGSARQYTVATTMEPTLYKLLTDALNNDGVTKDAIVDRIENNKSSNELSLTLKNYQVQGLSQAIHEKDGALFRVSGPMGRSLAVDKNGLNVAFAAGTGVLPFMDLIGYLARQTLAIDGIDSESLGADFFLWFNVRLNSDEAVGDELLSALAQANTD